MGKYSIKKMIYVGFVFVVMLLAGVFATTYAIFNYTKTSQKNTLSSSTVEFSSSVNNTINVIDDFPLDSNMSIEELGSAKNAHTGDLSITSHTTMTNGVRYKIYVIHGDDVSGKYRLNDSNIKFQLVPNFTSGENGFTIKTNFYAEPTNLSFDDEGHALISTGLVKNTSSSTTVTYDFLFWVDGESIVVSSTTKRATLPEGNPSLANTSSGNVTVARYMKNNSNDATVETLFPATQDQAGKTVYTTYEFSKGYYNLKIVVEAEEYKEKGSDKILDAIVAKESDTNLQCSNISYVEDSITYLSGTSECVDMNYVWYSGKLWRITAIYPDGLMKLVTQNNITTLAYYENDSSVFYTNASTASYVYYWLNEDFYDTLYNASQILDTTKRWNATMTDDRIVSAKLPETTMVTANVGLLNSYEFYNSYRCVDITDDETCPGTSDSSGYLHTGFYWWLLNPYSSKRTWVINVSGAAGNHNPNTSRGVRPSIYLKSGLEFTGTGTLSDPYRIVSDKNVGATNELINTRLSGEYVKLKNGNNEQVFRIIGVEDNKTKIIAVDHADNRAVRKYATGTADIDAIWGSGTTADTDTWYTYLNTPNTGYFDTLKSTYGELFDSGLYYLGITDYNYKLGVCANTTSGSTKDCTKTSEVGTFNIGLPRYGEMFATQQKRDSMWLINRFSSSYDWYIDVNAEGHYHNPTYEYKARPTVHLKSTVKILSGTGTESDPYIVGLSS